MKKLSVLLVLLIGICFTFLVKAEEGLVAYYSFEKGKGLEVYDDSGNGCNGKIAGGVKRVDGIFGKALKFDGRHGSKVVIPDRPNLHITEELTVSFWFRCDEFPVKEKDWKVAKVDSACLFSKNWNWRCRILPYRRIIASMGSPRWKLKVLEYSQPIKIGKWYHIAYVWSVSQSKFTLYIDGKKEKEITEGIFRLRDEKNKPLLLGEDPGNWNPFNGCIDEVRIYNRALSSEEISKLHKQVLKKISMEEIASWEESLKELEKKINLITSSGNGKEIKEEVKTCIASLRKKIEDIKKRGFLITFSEYNEINTSILYLNTIVTAMQEGKIKIKNLVCYVVKPISSVIRRPDTFPADGKISDTLFVIATPGEFEPASFILYPFKDITSLRLKATPLEGKKGIIPSSSVDIKVVKCWYQSGTAWYSIRQNRSKRVLVPELLLNDDSLVRVDRKSKDNYVRVVYPKGKEYVWIRVKEGEKDYKGKKVKLLSPEGEKYLWMSWEEDEFTSGKHVSIEDFPVKDSPVLLPVSIPGKTYKQFWVTIKVPEETKPGIYTGKINLFAEEEFLGDITIKLRVLPFTLAQPKTHYDLNKEFTSSIYYKGVLIPAGKGEITGKFKTEQQLRADLKDMYAHGVTNPLVYQLQYFDDLELLEKVLKIREEIGMGGKPLYLLGKEQNLGFGSPTDPAKLELLKERVKEILEVTKKFNIPEVYFYGKDEAKGKKLVSQREAWEAIHEAGGKIFVSGYKGSNFEAVGDIQDLLICSGYPSKDEAAKWHSVGHKIWCYANPQAGVENPEVYRRNFGLLLWKANYDGASTFIYHWAHGHVWNDFDNPTFRDHNFTYPTANGVIDTIAWEGYREGIDDIKYATTLKIEIEKAKKSGNKKLREVALSAEKYLEFCDVKKGDLDTIRLEIIRYILKLTKGR